MAHPLRGTYRYVALLQLVVFPLVSAGPTTMLLLRQAPHCSGRPLPGIVGEHSAAEHSASPDVRRHGAHGAHGDQSAHMAVATEAKRCEHAASGRQCLCRHHTPKSAPILDAPILVKRAGLPRADDAPHICACRHSGPSQPAMVGLDKYVTSESPSVEIVWQGTCVTSGRSVLPVDRAVDIFQPPRISSQPT